MEGVGFSTKLLASTNVKNHPNEEELGSEGKAGTRVEQLDLEDRDDALNEKDLKEGDTDNSNSTESYESSESADENDSDSGSSSPSSNAFKTPYHPQLGHVSAVEETQLSPDGTCIFTSDYDRTFSVYVIDQDILSTHTPRGLHPYAKLTSPDPIHAFSINPYFNLRDPRTTQVLLSKRDQYITLYNAIWDLSSHPQSPNNENAPIDITSSKLASYKLIDHQTEALLTPSSLTHALSGTHFIAGSKNQISIFDLTYTSDPVLRLRTIPSTRSKLKDGGRGYKGVVSALSISPTSGILAAGTRSRFVGLYDAEGRSGEGITHFALPGTVGRNKIVSKRNGNGDGDGIRLGGEALDGVIGNGVTQLKWSPCGMYLYVAERDSDTLLVYDVRNFAFALGYCVGRNAVTKQRLGFDVWSADAAGGGEGGGGGHHEVWAGGVDGEVRVWRDPHLREGAVEPDEVVGFEEEEQKREAPVSGVVVHPCGSLAVVSRGKRDGVEEGGEVKSKGRIRGGGVYPRFRDWGCVDIFGLGGYDVGEERV